MKNALKFLPFDPCPIKGTIYHTNTPKQKISRQQQYGSWKQKYPHQKMRTNKNKIEKINANKQFHNKNPS